MEKNSNSAKIENKARIFLFIVLYANFTRYVQSSIIDIGLPTLVIGLAGTLAAYGIVVGMFSLTQSIFQFPIAAASDKLGRKIMIIISIFIYIIGTFLCYFAQNIIELIIFRAIQGVGAYSSIIQAMIGDYYRKQHGKAMALYTLSITMGFFLGFIIGGYVAFYLGSKSIFLIAGILAIISLIIVIIFLKDSSRAYTTQRAKIKITDIKIILKEKQFKFILLINSLRWLLFFGIYAFIIWMLEIHYELTQIETISLLITVVLLYAISIVIGGYLTDRIGHKKIMLFGQFLIIIFGFLFFFGSGLIIFIIVSIFVSIGFAFLEIGGNAYLSKILEKTYPELKGSGFGLNNTLGFFFSAIGPIFICALGSIDILLPYYVVSFIIIVSLLITLKFVKN
jgi:MFS family permease